MEIKNLDKLTLETAENNPKECMKYLQQLTKSITDENEAQTVLKHILAIINNETGQEYVGHAANQVLLNVAFRCYFELMKKYDLKNAPIYDQLTVERLIQQKTLKESSFQILYAILMSERWKYFQADHLETLCLQAFKSAVQENSDSLLAILKALNLVYKKFPDLKTQPISLEYIYHCLECTQSGMREETLILATNCCSQSQHAFEYFQIVTEFWPWTNRNKYYLLNCILCRHSAVYFLSHAKQSIPEFFAGLRLSLSYKNLLSASQYLITTLGQQDSVELLTLAVEILTRGTLTEIQNFHSHWFAHIKQKDKLFESLQKQIEIMYFLKAAGKVLAADEVHRLVIIFSMFSRQIFAASKLYFFKISTELLTNCYTYNVDTQFYVFKFIADNLGSFAIEDSLEFILAFVKTHRSIENAQYRNSILAKMPTIINYISKSFNKVHTTTTVAATTTLEESIVTFFHTLQLMIEEDIASDLYQPKIFALKLLQILLNSLYAQKVQKNCKNCCLQQNQQLGLFLCERQVFNAVLVVEKLLTELKNAQGFDDASELLVALLGQLQNDVSAEAVSKFCLEFCKRSDVDECALSTYFAKVAALHSQEPKTLELYDLIMQRHLSADQLVAFQADPLLMCQNGQHLFGYIGVLNEIMLSSSHVHTTFQTQNFKLLLKTLDDILNIILDLLSLTHKQKWGNENLSAASFQDMDESLELIISASSYKAENHQESRKFLLMSFWLTLKACCDLATTIGCVLVTSSSESCEQEVVELLEACLDINVAVLTRCRHKGAIESAGVSIGKLTKCITSHLHTNASGYMLLHKCMQQLFDDGKQVSTTRRGAGFSIMFLHIIKNEDNPSRPIFRCAIDRILQYLQMTAATKTSTVVTKNANNCDHMEALTLHYLCVLVKDTELRHVVTKSYSEIMLAAIHKIDHTEWTICNAALQLFGALVPKIVGQKHATATSDCDAWEVCYVTYSEIARKFPKICEYILNYCTMKCEVSTATRSIILFLGFLAKVEHLRKSIDVDDVDEDGIEITFVQRIRLLMWRIMQHPCEKLRKLAATCFVRAHEFHVELPNALLQISQILFKVKNENFFHGLLYTLIEGIHKLEHESKYTLTTSAAAALDSFKQTLQMHLTNNFHLDLSFKLYTFSKLLDLLKLLGVDSQALILTQLTQLPTAAYPSSIGYDVWLEKVNY